MKDYLSLPRVIHILCAGTFLNRAGTFVIPFISIYARETLGFSVSFAATTVGVFGLGCVVGNIIGGHATDQLGRKPVMLMSLVGSALLILLLRTLTSPGPLLVVLFVTSLMYEMYRPAVSAMISDLTLGSERSHAFSLLYATINLGAAVGPVIAGFLMQKSADLLFILDAATTLAYAAIVAISVPESKVQKNSPATHESVVDPNFFESFWVIVRDRTFMCFCLAFGIVGFVYVQNVSSMPLSMQAQGFLPSQYGTVIALNGLLIAVFQLPLTPFLYKFNRAWVVSVAALLTGVGFGLNAFAASPWHYAIATAVWTLGEMMQSPFTPAITAELSPEHLRGRYFGFVGITYGVSNTLGAPLGGFALSRLGTTSLWIGCFLACLLAVVMYALIWKKIATHPLDQSRASSP